MDSELIKRFDELSNRAYMTGRVQYTDFLSMAELSELECKKNEYAYAGVDTFGGYEDAERKIVRFGEAEDYDTYPISVIKVTVSGGEKFSEPLSHRDYLGALMNLGIKRSLIGDIICDKGAAFIVCTERIAEYISENLISVARSRVTAEITSEEFTVEKRREEKKCFIPSMRADCIIGEAYNLSRRESLLYFEKELVFVSGRLLLLASKNLSVGDVVTVRGKGKFEIAEVSETKKGRLCATILKYV